MVSAVPGPSYYCDLKHFVRLKFSCLNFCALQVLVLELIRTVRFFASFREIRNTSLTSSFNRGIQYLRNTRHCASELDRAQTSAHDAMEFD